MAIQHPSVKRRRLPETVAQESMLRQASAAADSQSKPTRHARNDTLLQTTDLTAPGAAENDVAPPAYGESYGEIRDDKNGLGTSAHVAEDGRVNIRINQLNRHLSQLFTPALRQQVQSVQDSRPPPPPYIPPFLGGDKNIPPPPPLNIVIQVVGSRGDVQPFVALGKVLKDTYGHRVRLATHPTFKNFVQENDLEFFSIGGDPSKLMAFMVKNPGLMPGFRTLLSGDVGQRRKDVAEYIQGCWRSCYEAGDGDSPRDTDDDLSDSTENDSVTESTAKPFVADCIIANPPSFAHIHCAEKLGIPLHIMFTMPYSPTQAFPHPLANIQSSNADPQLTNYVSYAMIELLTWQGVGDIINRFRAKCLGLDPVSSIWAPGMLQRLKIPHTYCWSPALIPKPKDWGPNISISGFYFLDSASNYTPAPDLQRFLDHGPTPIYVGFGSIVLENPDAMTELIFEAVRKTGQRVLLSKGWGGMGSDELHVPDGVFILGNVPHDWLFRRVSCVVHHGGAGTTAAGIAAGRPTLVVPFFGDQPFWGAMVARAGAGPDPIPHKQLTADKLAGAIEFCLKPESLERAKELASKIAAEQGSDMGAQSFHQHLEVDRLRCTLAPSRPAAWRIKRTQVRLSAFAACTLANANLLDFHDLKLFRPQEYNTDEGPWDPISGGAAACLRAFSGMMMGAAEFPSETLKPFNTGSSRRQSRELVPKVASQDNISRVGRRSVSSTSPGHSQTNLDVHESLLHVQRASSSSALSSPVFELEASPAPDVLQGASSLKQVETGQSRVHSRSDSSFGKDRDMLRPTGVHMSKGLGRMVRSGLQAPGEFSVGLSKGFHNLPKLWGDDTVRPQEQVKDFKSGAVAAGKEFGFGWYDGITGLVTQPMRGARKEGAGGLAKGIGKGIGGFVAKPSAGLMGLLGYMLKGIQKEVQKSFGQNVQNHIVASRVAQGYEQWLQSSDAEKEDVIVQWKLIRKSLKKKRNADERVEDLLEAQRKENVEGTEAQPDYERTADSPRSADADTSTLDLKSTLLDRRGSQSSEGSLDPTETNDAFRLSVQDTSRWNAEEGANVVRAVQENISQPQRYTNEELEYEEQLKQAIAQSLREQTQRSTYDERESNIRLDEQYEGAERGAEMMAGQTTNVAGGSSSVQRSVASDPGHLAGITRDEFEARQHGQRRGKTTQERTEEEIVMEYIKKQSLLEAHHQNRGKGRADAMEDENEKGSRGYQG